MVGLAYHAGVLHALEQVGGLAADDADLIVGTSAGSVAGAYLRSGWTTTDLWHLAQGTHPELGSLAGDGTGRGGVMSPMFTSPFDLWRRTMGSTFVLTRSFLRVPAPRVPRLLQAAFPAGMFAMLEGRRRFTQELPDEWPERPLWLCAVDITRGRRVVLGRGPKATDTSLRTAVLASCAIPWLYPPVRIGRMTLVDGGAVSTTNLDLAASAGCDLIVAVVPMAYDAAAGGPVRGVSRMVRRIPTRSLAGEVAEARRRGATVLLLRPSAAEVDLHGFDSM